MAAASGCLKTKTTHSFQRWSILTSPRRSSKLFAFQTYCNLAFDSLDMMYAGLDKLAPQSRIETRVETLSPIPGSPAAASRPQTNTRPASSRPARPSSQKAPALLGAVSPRRAATPSTPQRKAVPLELVPEGAKAGLTPRLKYSGALIRAEFASSFESYRVAEQSLEKDLRAVDVGFPSSYYWT